MSIDEPVLTDDPGDQDTGALPGEAPDEGATAGPGDGGGPEDPVDGSFVSDEPPVPGGGDVRVTDAFLGPQETVVTQVPLHTDPALITTVADVRSTPAYQQWQAEQPDDGVIGDVSDARFWFEQSTDYTCAPAVATQIIEDFTGTERADEDYVADYAAERGMLDEDGMYPDHLATVLTELGVPSEVKHDQTWEDVATYLEEGRSVVMTVDSGDYWPGHRDSSDGLDHVVRVVAIDTERGVAILSDPGHPDGQQLEVPLETLDEAWSSPNGTLGEDRMLIVSEQPDPTPDEGSSPDPFALDDAAAPDEGTTGLDPFGPADVVDGISAGRDFVGQVFANPAGWVLVPVTLAASRIFSAVKGR